MKIVYTKVLSKNAPSFDWVGMPYVAGDELIVHKLNNNEYYYSIGGVKENGLPYTTEDQGPFNTLEEAVAAALERYKRQNF